MAGVLRFVDDAAARGKRRIEPRPYVLASDRHVDVHRVPQRVGRGRIRVWPMLTQAPTDHVPTTG